MEPAEAFRWYAEWADGVSPLYTRLAEATADDPDLLSIAAEAPDTQPPPQLFLAAVHAVLMENDSHPLAEFYPTCTDESVVPAESDPIPSFRSFCRQNEGRLREVIATRRVQTNAVGRSAVLFPSFEFLNRTEADPPLALVEIGASAGLNLYWDQFKYTYEGYGTYGDSDSPVHIESGVRGDIDPPLADTPPTVETRIGIDINPLDVTKPADARWLQALVIPDQEWRHERLAAALDMVRHQPPELVEGDAITMFPEVLSDIPMDQTVCVFSTHTLYQLPSKNVEELKSILRTHSQDRPIHWLSGKPSGNTESQPYRYVLFEGGQSEETQLAEYKSYGEWIRWEASVGTGLQK